MSDPQNIVSEYAKSREPALAVVCLHIHIGVFLAGASLVLESVYEFEDLVINPNGWLDVGVSGCRQVNHLGFHGGDTMSIVVARFEEWSICVCILSSVVVLSAQSFAKRKLLAVTS